MQFSYNCSSEYHFTMDWIKNKLSIPCFCCSQSPCMLKCSRLDNFVQGSNQQAWWCTALIPVLWRENRETQKFKASLDYAVIWKPEEARWDLISTRERGEEEQKKEKEGERQHIIGQLNSLHGPIIATVALSTRVSRIASPKDNNVLILRIYEYIILHGQRDILQMWFKI